MKRWITIQIKLILGALRKKSKTWSADDFGSPVVTYFRDGSTKDWQY
jgi:hypothetical protein